MEKEIQQKINELEEYRPLIREVTDRLMQYSEKDSERDHDIFLIACLNRSANLLEGFVKMTEMENFLCAAPLIRLNLDTLLRMFASKIYIGTDRELLQELLKGVHFQKLKDHNGNEMGDGYLKKLISENKGMEWVKNVYDVSSGYIHLSDKHLLSITREFLPNNRIAIQIRNTSPIPPKEQLGAINIFIRTTVNIIEFIEGRIKYLKENP